MSDRILRRKDVEQLTGLSRSTIYRHVNAGTFPAPVKLTERLIGWRASAISGWMDSRAEL
ncbi:transcriptional regulator, AlpA family [Roseovarius lutimaris]|uniref:Transcriptional regulator, AlpA family n=1 Tax=Roseovarius lutimaris TaxID=1005928 RepID=A0A1I5FU04_9RHOB|nr:AlpA family transcriptional regulator [Roseovarius lutimaris]SFO27109.1 transcriptional regulator, AlpA family [Roseovarius lutimaris]